MKGYLNPNFYYSQMPPYQKYQKKCGFSDVKYFYKNFKRWYGCMPLEHRSKCVEYIKKGFQLYRSGDKRFGKRT